jgi:serine/threonine-protein kinase
MWRRLVLWLVRGAYLVAVVALFVVSGYVAFSLFVRRGVTPVPGLVGLPLEEAAQRLADHGLELRHDEEEDRFAEEVPPGRVLEQSPAAGSFAKRGGQIEVVLSRGRRRIGVPDLGGKSLAAAQVTLAAAGLQVGRVAQVFAQGGTSVEGTVLEQDPVAGTEVGRSSPVHLFLVAENLGERYLMPDLIDRDYREVRHFFERHGFRVGSIKFEPYEGVSRAVVLRQFPLPGHPLRRGEVISLVVAAVPGALEVGA